MFKGIILAGGEGTRLRPITTTISKQILPVYDKPMIYYPLATLMLAGIKDILIISTPRDLPSIEGLLGDGHQLGISIQYKEQPSPDGLPQAFTLGEEFIADDNVCMILGDNIFYGQNLRGYLERATSYKQGACMMAYHVTDPRRYGVVEFDHNNTVISIEEKPEKPRSNWVLTGIYFFDSDIVNIAKNLKPSSRGETEITDAMKPYLEKNTLKVEVMGRGMAWLDTGTPDSLLDASQFIQTIEKRQGLKVCCIEEIAYNMGYIDKDQLLSLAKTYGNAEYGTYLKHVLNDGFSN